MKRKTTETETENNKVSSHKKYIRIPQSIQGAEDCEYKPISTHTIYNPQSKPSYIN